MKKFYDTILDGRGGSTTNNKLSPVTVYVPVNVSKEYPPINEEIITFEGSEIKISELTIGVTSCTTNWDEKVTNWGWLKEQERYIFTKEELESFLKDFFRNAQQLKQYPDFANYKYRNPEDLIQSLF